MSSRVGVSSRSWKLISVSNIEVGSRDGTGGPDV